MDKELEEAIKWLEDNIKYYQEQIKFIEATDCDYYDEEKELYEKRIKIFKTLLNYIENSMPKSVVEEKIEEQRELIEEYRKLKEYEQIDIRLYKISVLQELLQENKKII